MRGYPLSRGNGVLDRGRKFVLGSEAVTDGKKSAAGRFRECGAYAVMGIDAAGNHAAAMEVDESRTLLAVIKGAIQTVRNILRRTRQHAVDPDDCRPVGAHELHEFRKCLAAV